MTQAWIGITGIAMFALTLVGIPLYFVYSGPPPAMNVLTRLLVNMFVVVAFIVWVVGFQGLVVHARPEYEWLGMMCMLFGGVHAVLTLAANSIEGGTVLGRGERLDPTVVGAGGEGALIIYGPVSRLLEAAFLVCAGSAILVTGIAAQWSGWLAYGVGLLQLAFVPTIFSKPDPTRFRSLNGWNIPITAGSFLAWVFTISMLLVLG